MHKINLSNCFSFNPNRKNCFLVNKALKVMHPEVESCYCFNNAGEVKGNDSSLLRVKKVTSLPKKQLLQSAYCHRVVCRFSIWGYCAVPWLVLYAM